MIAVSNEFKTAMKQPVKELQAYISDIKSEDDLISFKISCESSMCKTAMRKLEAKYTGEHNLLGQWVHAGFGVKLPSGTFEYLDYGSFLVTEITTVKDTGITTIVAYDRMINAMTSYQPLDVEYPVRLIDYTKLLCNACNLELANEGFSDNLYNKELLSSMPTYSESINADYYFGCKYQLSPNTTYTIKVTNNGYVGDWGWIYAIYDSNKQFIARLQEGAKSEDITVTFTTDDTGIIYFAHLYATQERLDTWFNTVTIKLQKGLTADNYSEYNRMNDWLINTELWGNINGITYRDIFVEIAQATGTTCIISEDKVYFKPLTDTGETLTYDNMFKLKLEPKYGEINSVVLARTPQEDNIYMRDEASIENNGLTEFKIENNEIVDKDRNNAITPIYEALKGINYYPFETTTEGLGWYEIGDKIDIINDTGDTFNTCIFNLNINIDGSIKETLKAIAETKTQTQYQYATTIAKRVKNTEIITNKQEQYIQQLVSDMYEENGVINENFAKIYLDILNIVNSVQNSGGSNLIKNSVMFAYDNEGIPRDWEIIPKNLFDINGERVDKYSIVSTVSENTLSTECTGAWSYLEYYNIKVKKGQTYTVSFDFSNPSNNSMGLDIRSATGSSVLGYIQSTDANGKKSFTFIADDDVVTMRICSNNTGNVSTNTVTYSNIQIEEGIVASEYVPRKECQLLIDSNIESLNAGGLSGHSFTLANKTVRQQIYVGTNSYYTFSTRIKKGLDGSCYVKLYNSREEHIIELNEGEESFYNEYELKSLSPKDNYYIVEFYGSVDSNATFTDNMLAIGEYKSKWSQANGEIMNTQVNVSLDGVLVKSSVYLGDYTVMSPLEFAGYSNINGTITKVFSLNKDVTYMSKAEIKKEVRMIPIKVVPITEGELQGWAFVPSTEEV